MIYEYIVMWTFQAVILIVHKYDLSFCEWILNLNVWQELFTIIF